MKSKTFSKFTVLLITYLLFSGEPLLAQSGWQLIYTGPMTGVGINSLYFTDPNTGYGTYRGGIIKTSNAGVNWQTVAPFSDLLHRSIYFINSNTGFIAAAGLTSDTGEVFKTTNAGINWTACTLPFKRHFTNAYFIDQNTGYVSGYAVILKTTNTGLNWEATYLPGYYFFAICFTDPNTGYVVGNGGKIFKTTNAGASWQQLNTGTNIHLWGISFANANTGCAVGGTSSIDIVLRTTDGGSSWTQPLYGVYNTYLWTIKFVNQSTGFILGDNGNILKSTNSGFTWFKQQCPNFYMAGSMYFINPDTGYASGDLNDLTGFIFKTTTGGETAIRPISNEIPGRYSLSQNYPNPFNPATKITFDLPKSSDVKLILYNLLGREIEVLVNEKLSPGTYEVDFYGTNYPSGVYFYTIRTIDFTDTKKMILVK